MVKAIVSEPWLASNFLFVIKQDAPLQVQSKDPYQYTSVTEIEIRSSDFTWEWEEGDPDPESLEFAQLCDEQTEAGRVLVGELIFHQVHVSDYYSYEDAPSLRDIFDCFDQFNLYHHLIGKRWKEADVVKLNLDLCFAVQDFLLLWDLKLPEYSDISLLLMVLGIQKIAFGSECTIAIWDEKQSWDRIGMRYHKPSKAWVCGIDNLTIPKDLMPAFNQFFDLNVED